MKEFTISSETLTAKTAVTKMAGDMEQHAFDMLEDEFSKLMESGVLGIVLDMSGLESMPSSAIGALVNMNRLLTKQKGKLVAAAVPKKLMGLFDLLGLGETLTFADSIEAGRKLVAAVK